MRAVLTSAIVVTWCGVAAAQPSLTEPSVAPATSPALDFTKPKPPEYKNPATATWLSIGASAVGAGGILLGSQMHDGDTPIMIIGGLISVFGPSVGDWWANDSARITGPLGVRIIGATIAGIGLGRAVDQGCDDNVCDAPLQNRHSDTLIGLGVATIAVGTIWDIAVAGRHAERHNARFGLTPTTITTARGTTPGIGLSGRF